MAAFSAGPIKTVDPVNEDSRKGFVGIDPDYANGATDAYKPVKSGKTLTSVEKLAKEAEAAPAEAEDKSETKDDGNKDSGAPAPSAPSAPSK